jgi:soluble lytic murein transglycosylase
VIAATIFATNPPRPTATTALTPTPTLAPTPTPDPAQLERDAQAAAFIGNYARAIALQQQSLAVLGNPESEAALHGQLSIGQWQLANGDLAGAIATLQPLADLSGSPVQTDARVLLGRALERNQQPIEAMAQYSAALAAGSVISPWLSLWLGDDLMASSQPTVALPYLQASLDGAPNLSQGFSRREKIALAQQLSGNLPAAIEQYDSILSRATFPAYRARILYESAQALLAAGQNAAAYQRLNEVVTTHPTTASAAPAVQALLNAGQPVDDLQRGIIAYNNRSYEAARDAFRRAIETADAARANEVRYWAALNYLRLGSPADALRNLDQTITANPPNAPAVAQALGEKAKFYANAGDATNARLTFTQLISNAPAGEVAAQAMFGVGQQFARNANLVSEAAQAFQAAAALHFDAERGAEALSRAAGLEYRLGRLTDVITTAQTLSDGYASESLSLQGPLWLGKAQLALGDVATGTATLQALAQRSPDSYEGVRAAELAADPNRAPLSLPPSPLGAERPRNEAEGREGRGEGAELAQQEEAETWLRAWLNISDTVDVRSPGEAITGDPRYQRGMALWRLGFKNEAREEFEGLRAAFTQDALAQYQLALLFRDIGLYRSSIGAADTLMRLSPAKTPSALPAFMAKLLYPTYYADLVSQHAQEYGLDPLLVFSLIRQESLFEPFAVSSAAANGLMQVIPSTGREINGDLGWPPDYTTADLQKPYVVVRFGTYYLNKQRNFLKGDLYAALAAYNGGAGNALIWEERSGGDPDVFFTEINFEETQRYIRAIAANYAIYHRLYGDRAAAVSLGRTEQRARP